MRRPSVLFVCTGNACRSQMAEAICRHLAGDRIDVHSCGSHPAGYIHPLAVATLERMGISLAGQHSKSWDEYLHRDFDVVVTVCESADALCPVFPGGGVKVHWPMPDPSFMPGSEDERLDFCHRVAQRLELKIGRMIPPVVQGVAGEKLRSELEKLTDL